MANEALAHPDGPNGGALHWADVSKCIFLEKCVAPGSHPRKHATASKGMEELHVSDASDKTIDSKKSNSPKD